MLATINTETMKLLPLALAFLNQIDKGGKFELPESLEVLFKETFLKGGLDSVDDLIDSLNESLDALSSPYKFREGCALQEIASTKSSFLHLFAESCETTGIVAKFEIEL